MQIFNIFQIPNLNEFHTVRSRGRNLLEMSAGSSISANIATFSYFNDICRHALSQRIVEHDNTFILLYSTDFLPKYFCKFNKTVAIYTSMVLFIVY